MSQPSVAPVEPSELALGRLIAGRYRVVSDVGTGGVAQVVCAFDEKLERTVALKALQPEARRNRERLLASFRHEYTVLTQVAHPNVVKVYDFGFAGDLPFYTMELIEGQALNELAPLPADEVIDLLRCLCEPLSIVHQRRWVHRDLSARNVIRTNEGAIKLIDFGATVSMDDRHAPMGTPPFMPPEALAQELLDARADIFGLGALAYYALTGRHAYPARTLANLTATWKQRPRRVRELAAETPQPLDDLVMSMLNLDAAARPRGTAEVLQHLRSGSRDSVPVSRATTSAHLETPKLIGRDVQLRQFQGLLMASSQGRGSVCVIQGERGMGRSRLLDALGLQVRLAGHPVVRASGKLAGNSPLALARAIGETALRVLVDDRDGAKLAWLSDGTDLSTLSSDALAEAHRELVEWLSAQSERGMLALLVDDVDAADAASQKLLAQLALVVRKRRMLLAVTSDSSAGAGTGANAGVGGGALQMLRQHGVLLNLVPFSESEVEDWARATFGDVHNVARLARWLSSVAAGKPADCMAFARYLVEQGIAVRSAGAFTLPDAFDGLSLPTSVRDALQSRLATLGPDARTFVELLATEIQPPPFTIDDYLRLLDEQGGDSIAAISELTSAQVLAATENGYVLRSGAVLDWARGQLSDEQRRTLRRQLAACHKEACREDSGSALIAALHFWKAGDLAAADEMIGDGVETYRVTRGPSAAFMRTADAALMLEAMLAYRKEVGAPPARISTLRVALITRASLTSADLVSYIDEAMVALRYDLGLDLWNEQPAEVSDKEKTLRCFNAATARHAATPVEKRGHSPFDALKLLAITCGAAAGAYTIRFEPHLCKPLEATICLYRGVSPGLDVVIDVVENPAKSQGQGADVSDFSLRSIAATKRPIADFDDELRQGIHWLNTYYYAIHLAAEGRDEALELVPALEARPQYAVLGLQTRRIHALMTGRYREAQRYRRERELLALQSEASDQHLHASVLREQQAAHACGDLLELTRCGAELRERVKRFPGWTPWLIMNDARVCMNSGNAREALMLLESTVVRIEPFTHAAWTQMSTLRADALQELGRHEEAIAVARDVLDRAAAAGVVFDVTRYRLNMLIGASQVALGQVDDGLAAMTRVIEEAEVSPGPQSLIFGKTCEIRCEVALAMKDEQAFTKYAARLTQLYSQHPALRARYERMQRRARDCFEAQGVDPEQPDARAWSARLQTALATQSSEDQADYLLSIVLEEIGADLGQLYRVDRRGQPLLAACRPKPPDPTLMQHALRCITMYATNLDETDTQSVDDEKPSDATATIDSMGVRYETVWLRHPDRPDELRGMVVVPSNSARLFAITPDLQRALCERLLQIG